MTMFSMKPKFDLAAFLAEPAKVGASRRRGATYGTPKPPPEEKAEVAAPPKPKSP
jgi:hypothetical protein